VPGDGRHGGHRRLSGAAIEALAGERRQAQQHERGHGATGRQGVVLQAPRSCHKGLRVVRRIAEAAVLGAEVLQDQVRQLARRYEEAFLEGGFVERRAAGEVGAIPGAVPGAAILPGALQSTVRAQPRSRKSAASVAISMRRLIQDPAGIREAAGQPIPGAALSSRRLGPSVPTPSSSTRACGGLYLVGPLEPTASDVARAAGWCVLPVAGWLTS
jgi:hypothetical protein